MKYIKMYLCSLIFFSVMASSLAQVNTQVDSVFELFHSHKLLPEDIKQIFENQIRKEEVLFTDYSQMDKHKACRKKTPLIFLFCTISNHEDIVMAVYNLDEPVPFGHYFYFKINENKKVVESKEIAMLEMICDPSRLEIIVDDKAYDLKLSKELLKNKGRL